MQELLRTARVHSTCWKGRREAQVVVKLMLDVVKLMLDAVKLMLDNSMVDLNFKS